MVSTVLAKRGYQPVVASDVRSIPVPTHATDASGIHGSLRQLGLPALLVMLEMERKSGILILEFQGTTARLFAQSGRIVAARIDRGEITGADVVYALLA